MHELGVRDFESPGSGTQIVSAGKIHLLGIEAIKTRLGPKWERMSGLVHRYFEAAIKREQRPGDTFCSFGELSYLVLFCDATISEAQLKCAVIVEDVCRRLFGEEGEDISVRNLVAPIDAVVLSNMQEQLRLNDVLERNGREVLFSNKNGVTIASTEQPFRVKIGTAPGPIHMIARDKPSFVYRPFWDTSRNVILTYVCQLLPDTARLNAPFGLPCASIDGEDEQSTLDMMALRECLQRASYLRRAGHRVLLATPLHFTTLSRPRLWTRYNAFLNASSSELFRDIAFMVHGFDAGVPNIRLVQELPKLSRFSKHLFCAVDDSENAGHRFRNTGVHAVGFAVQPGRPERYWIDRMKNFVRDTRDCALEPFALGVISRSMATNAIGAGMRYLEGLAVRPSVADPKHAFVHEVEDLYRGHLETISLAMETQRA